MYFAFRVEMSIGGIGRIPGCRFLMIWTMFIIGLTLAELATPQILLLERSYRCA